jgi:uncharacterized membrane protein YdjX (TVP38/TMEM64 family)
MRKHWQKTLAVGIWLVLFGSVLFYAWQQQLSLQAALQQLLLSLVIVLQSPYGPLWYILCYTVRPLFLFSAVVMTLLGGSVYGPVWGIVYVLIGSNSGAMLAYTVGRFFGKGLLSNVGDESGWIARYTQRMQRASFLTVFTMRLIYLPYDLVNYLAGFLHIDWRSFLLATALGSIPGTIAFTLFGASIPVTAVFSGQLPRPNPWVLVASLLIFGVSNWIARYFKQRESQNT